MREITINNRPVSDYLYEFTVVMPNADSTYDFIWEGTNGFKAEEIAYQHKGSVILHNVRISGKEKKKKDLTK